VSNKPNDDDTAFHAFEVSPELAARLIGAMAHRRQPPTFADLADRIRPGMWGRAVEDTQSLTIDGVSYRDGVIVIVPPVGDVLTQPHLAGRVLVVAYDDIEHDRTELMLHRETVRALVNALSEAVAESELVERAATAAKQAADASRQEETR
jgi:hypothetical protein